jgi:hypothetical protein
MRTTDIELWTGLMRRPGDETKTSSGKEYTARTESCAISRVDFPEG